MPAKPARNRKVGTAGQLHAVADAYQYTACHGPLRHAWDAVGPIPGARRPRLSFGTQVTFRCLRCATLRFDVFSRLTGDLLYRHYEHPDGYKTEKHNANYWRAAFMDEMDGGLLVDLEDE